MKAIILSSGRADKSLTQLYGDIPTGLIPVNGRPGIFFIVNRLIDCGIRDIYITVGYQGQKLKRLLSNTYETKVRLHFIETDAAKRPGHSLVKAMSTIDSDEVIVNLGDTLIAPEDIRNLLSKGRVGTAECTVAVSNNFYHADLWCSVKTENERVLAMYDSTPVLRDSDLQVMCGLYLLRNVPSILAAASHIDNPEISDVLKCANQILCADVNNWLDFGHIHTLQRTKKNLLEARVFNELSFNDFFGTITKRSENTFKFIDEIKWQVELPEELKILTPRVVDYSLDEENPHITMEYYSYQTVSELWLYSSYDQDVFKEMIDKLLRLLIEIKKTERGSVDMQDFKAMYVEKTLSRVRAIEKDETFKKLLSFPTLVINGKEYCNWKGIASDVLALTDGLWNEEDTGLIHGDYCFSNILYDISSGIVRLLDPRGRWGKSKYGDIKYDLAKMRHSISGGYDFIVNDLFDVEVKEDVLEYTLFGFEEKRPIADYFDQKLAESFNVRQIQLIEGLLFLTMIPYHSNSQRRQYVMYCKAIELLNKVLTH
jgi:dTDP-glucose pyrophosphorylase